MQITRLKKIQDTLRFGLILNELRHLFRKIGIEISPFYWTQEEISGHNPSKLKGRLKDYTFGFLGPDEIKLIPSLAKNHPEDMLLSRIKKGKLCYGIKYKNQIAAFTWLDLDECNYKGNRHALDSDAVYAFDLYTTRLFRGENLAPNLRYKSYGVLKKMGKKRIYSVTQMTNRPAIKFKKKLNAKFLWLGVYINLFNKINRTFILKRYRS